MNSRVKNRFMAFAISMAKCNYVAALNHCQKTWIATAKQQKVYLSQCQPGLDWGRVVYKGAKQTGKYAYDVKFTVGKHTYRARLICEIKEYTPSLFGRWGVNPYSIKRSK